MRRLICSTMKRSVDESATKDAIFQVTRQSSSQQTGADLSGRGLLGKRNRAAKACAPRSSNKANNPEAVLSQVANTFEGSSCAKEPQSMTLCDSTKVTSAPAAQLAPALHHCSKRMRTNTA